MMRILPPGIQTLSSYIFGSLFIQVSDLRTHKDTALTSYRANFFGSATDENMNSLNQPSHKNSQIDAIGSIQQYKIGTNLWLFYTYLSDMQNIDVEFYNSNMNTNCYCRHQILLKNVRGVMNPDFKGNNIIGKEEIQRVTIVDNMGNIIGSVGIRIWTEFDAALHEEIKQLINFNSMVIFEGISPINSQTELPREPPQQSFVSSSYQQIQKLSKVGPVTQEKNNPNYFEVYQSEIKEDQDQESHRMIQQDIDKLIRELQSKPYDSSRYQQNKQQAPQPNKYVESIYGQFNNSHEASSNYHKNSYNDSHGSYKFMETQTSLKHESIPSMARPPQPQFMNKIQSQVLEKKSLTHSNSNNLLKVIKGQHSVGNKPVLQNNPSSNSYIQLKIHEMQFSFSSSISHNIINQIIQPCYTLKIYQNNDTEEYFIGQGVKQGEIIKFSQELKVRNLNHLQNLKFTICDDYGRAQCEGIFQISRLLSSNSQKGVFIVSLLPLTGGTPQPQVKASQKKLVQVLPLARTLRIEAQLIERVQMVQIFIKVSKANIPFNMLRYKIPLTKQTIEYIGNNHINIFPHSMNSNCPDKIILQFWRNEQNIGQSELSLKNIKNVNINTLNTSIDPIYLYDGKKQIRNILQGDRIVGDYSLLLCFGTVKQIQSLILATIDQEKQVIKQQNQKILVAFDERLGVIVNKKPTQSNEVSIQVQIEPQEHDPHFLQESMHLLAKCQQPSFGQQSRISHTSNNEFLDHSLMSFAKPSQISIKPQQIIQTQYKIQNKLVKRASLSYPTITEKIGQTISELLQPIVGQINKLKQLCKPHLLYNFIAVNSLKNILGSLGCNTKTIDLIFKLALFAKEEMINVNILYDLCLSIQIEGCIKAHLINDQMLIVGALRLLYKNQQLRKNILLEHDLQFKEMAAIYQKVGLKIVLHEFQTLQKFLSKYKTKKDAEELKKAIINELQSENIQEIKQGFYEQDILKQIYGDDSSFNNSGISEISQDMNKMKVETVVKATNKEKQDEKVPKFAKQHNIEKTKPKIVQVLTKSPKIVKAIKYKLSISGISNVRDSAECVFDTLPSETYFRMVIDSPVFEELTFNTNQTFLQFEATGELKDISGRVQFVSGNTVLACSAFSLISGMESLYTMKTREGHFCGLFNIKAQ